MTSAFSWQNSLGLRVSKLCLEAQVSSGQPQGQGLLLEEVTINPTLELPELTQDWGIDSWRAQTEPCAPGPRRKEQ